jgi:hypothetical protein
MMGVLTGFGFENIPGSRIFLVREYSWFKNIPG